MGDRGARGEGAGPLAANAAAIKAADRNGRRIIGFPLFWSLGMHCPVALVDHADGAMGGQDGALLPGANMAQMFARQDRTDRPASPSIL